jgi:hypothetical protein
MVVSGATYDNLEEKLDIAPSTMTGFIRRRERYLGAIEDG